MTPEMMLQYSLVLKSLGSQTRVQEAIGRGWDSHLTTGSVSEFMCNTAIHSMVLACFHRKELSLEGGV